MITYFLKVVFTCYNFMLMARIIMSWFRIENSEIVVLLRRFTDPYLGFFRKIVPTIGMLDISPLLAFFALQFMQFVLINILNGK